MLWVFKSIRHIALYLVFLAGVDTLHAEGELSLLHGTANINTSGLDFSASFLETSWIAPWLWVGVGTNLFTVTSAFDGYQISDKGKIRIFEYYTVNNYSGYPDTMRDQAVYFRVMKSWFPLQCYWIPTAYLKNRRFPASLSIRALYCPWSVLGTTLTSLPSEKGTFGRHEVLDIGVCLKIPYVSLIAGFNRNVIKETRYMPGNSSYYQYVHFLPYTVSRMYLGMDFSLGKTFLGSKKYGSQFFPDAQGWVPIPAQVSLNTALKISQIHEASRQGHIGKICEILMKARISKSIADEATTALRQFHQPWADDSIVAFVINHPKLSAQEWEMISPIFKIRRSQNLEYALLRSNALSMPNSIVASHLIEFIAETLPKISEKWAIDSLIHALILDIFSSDTGIVNQAGNLLEKCVERGAVAAGIANSLTDKLSTSFSIISLASLKYINNFLERHDSLSKESKKIFIGYLHRAIDSAVCAADTGMLAATSKMLVYSQTSQAKSFLLPRLLSAKPLVAEAFGKALLHILSQCKSDEMYLILEKFADHKPDLFNTIVYDGASAFDKNATHRLCPLLMKSFPILVSPICKALLPFASFLDERDLNDVRATMDAAIKVHTAGAFIDAANLFIAAHPSQANAFLLTRLNCDKPLINEAIDNAFVRTLSHCKSGELYLFLEKFADHQPGLFNKILNDSASAFDKNATHRLCPLLMKSFPILVSPICKVLLPFASFLNESDLNGVRSAIDASIRANNAGAFLDAANLLAAAQPSQAAVFLLNRLNCDKPLITEAIGKAVREVISAGNRDMLLTYASLKKSTVHQVASDLLMAIADSVVTVTGTIRNYNTRFGAPVIRQIFYDGVLESQTVGPAPLMSISFEIDTLRFEYTWDDPDLLHTVDSMIERLGDTPINLELTKVVCKYHIVTRRIVSLNKL
jgi:hypothetical protein